ncbi:hypothetical protein CH063_07310 [Colletotrichum higginsianum]|uniref:Uncharacterized protein n=1 Tax=Colletotrichum higginsianum (strain IMI 349063) TaxID=759273 RepID=H1V5Q3_COLHI|nr:hypothetical protein CH063_07310 [Colletotrichum higginsianum]
MDDDPATSHARDKEALRSLADELLELEADRDLQQVIVESYETAPNPDAYSNDKKGAVRTLEAVKKTIDDKKLQKRRLEQRIHAARSADRQTARDVASGEDRNMWEARNRWGTGMWIFSVLVCYSQCPPNGRIFRFHDLLWPWSVEALQVK